MAFQIVATLDDIPDGHGLCVRVGELQIGLYRVDGEIHAMENRCPHRDHPLHEGVLRGAVIECAAHGWEFDVRTGFNPEDDDGWPIPCFAVQIEEERISVDVEQVINRRQRLATRTSPT